jgi:hypothetical protein
MALGGLAVLTIFSLLAMAYKQDEDQDQLEITLCRGPIFTVRGHHEDSQTISLSPSTSTLKEVAPPKPL